MNAEGERRLTHAERVERRLEIVKELKENKKLWLMAGAATSIVGLIIAFRYYSKEKAESKELRSSLDQIIQEVEENYAPASQRLGEGAILIAVEPVAQDLTELGKTKEGKRFLTWLKKVCGSSGVQPGMQKSIEGQLIHASVEAGDRIVRPEIDQKK